MSRRPKVIRYCKCCGRQIEGKGRSYYCPNNPVCQADKAKALKEYLRIYALAYKPWRKTSRALASLKRRQRLKYRDEKPCKAPMRKCPFCGHATINHFACDRCIERRAGIDTMYQTVM